VLRTAPTRNRALLLALALAVAVPASQAAPAVATRWPEPAPRMTGETLLRRLKPIDPATITVPPNVRGNLNKQDLADLHTINNVNYVEGYLEALYDATEGTVWCYNAKAKVPKPDTFFDESRQGLYRVAADQLKRPAEELLLEIWRAKWPCSADRRSDRRSQK
jgi:hypothetical protein